MEWAAKNMPCKWPESAVHALGVGETDFAPPKSLLNELTKAVKGIERYSAYQEKYGIPRVNRSIIDVFQSRYGFSNSELLATPIGSIRAFLQLVARMYMKRGASMLLIIGSPYYNGTADSFRGCARSFAAVNFRWAAGKYELDVETLDEITLPEKSVILVTNPNNPTGHQLTRREMEGISRCAERSGALVISDEVYEFFSMPGRHIPIVTGSRYLSQHSIVLSGVGKFLNVSGWKSSYAIFPRALSQTIYGWMDQTVIPSTLSQIGLMLGLGNLDRNASNLEIIQANRKIISDYVEKNFPRISVNLPSCGYLAVARANSTTDPNTDVSDVLLNSGIHVFGCRHFSGMQRHEFRLNFGTTSDNLLRSLSAIDSIFERLS